MHDLVMGFCFLSFYESMVDAVYIPGAVFCRKEHTFEHARWTFRTFRNQRVMLFRKIQP